jgi:hypothetical protein
MDVIKVEPDSDCEAQMTSECSDVKEEEQSIPIIKHEDEVGLLLYFSLKTFFINFIYSHCILNLKCETTH